MNKIKSKINKAIPYNTLEHIIVHSDFPNLKLFCFGKENFKLEFNSILGMENNNEFFDKYNAALLEHPFINKDGFYPSVTFAELSEFKHILSDYQLSMIGDNTKMYNILSTHNFVTVYTDDDPIYGPLNKKDKIKITVANNI